MSVYPHPAPKRARNTSSSEMYFANEEETSEVDDMSNDDDEDFESESKEENYDDEDYDAFGKEKGEGKIISLQFCSAVLKLFIR